MSGPQEPLYQGWVEVGAPDRDTLGSGLGPSNDGLLLLTLPFSVPTCLCLTPTTWASIHGWWLIPPAPHLFLARTKENGSDRDPLHPDHLSKRPCTLSPAQRCSPSNGLPHPTPSPHYRLEDMAMVHHFRDAYRHPDPRELRERHRQLGEQCSGSQCGHEWLGACASPCACANLCVRVRVHVQICA
jgi:hypothetical protein